MDIKEFFNYIKKSIETEIPGVTIQIGRKPEDDIIQRTGIYIHKKGEIASPLLWLDYYHSEYLNGKTREEIIAEIIRDWKWALDHLTEIPEASVLDWEEARDKVFLTLMSEEKRKCCQKEDIFTVDFLDLKLVVRFCLHLSSKGIQSFPVTRKLALHHWGITEEELIRTAGDNTETMFPPSLWDMYQHLSTIQKHRSNTGQGELIHGEEPLSDGMYLLFNCRGIYGASSICYDGLLPKLFRRFGKGFYVIPSSIHEMILFPEPSDPQEASIFQPEEFRKLIYHINRTELRPDERLSDSLYYYDGKELTIVEGDTGLDDAEPGGGTDE